MEDKFHAVIDTNVIVSAIISKHLGSNPAKIIRAIVQERIVLRSGYFQRRLIPCNRQHQTLPRQAFRCHPGRNGQDNGTGKHILKTAVPENELTRTK